MKGRFWARFGSYGGGFGGRMAVMGPKHGREQSAPSPGISGRNKTSFGRSGFMRGMG